MKFSSLKPTTPDRMTLARWVPGDQLGTHRLARFDSGDFFWLEDDNCGVALLINGKDSTYEISQSCNGKLYGDSAMIATRMAIEICKQFEITSDLFPVVEVRVEGHAFSRPVISAERDRFDQIKYGPCFHNMNTGESSSPRRFWYMGSEEVFAEIERRTAEFEQAKEKVRDDNDAWNALFAEFADYMQAHRFGGYSKPATMIWSSREQGLDWIEPRIEEAKLKQGWNWTEHGIEQAAANAKIRFLVNFPPVGKAPDIA